MKAKIYNIQFEIDKKGNIKGPSVIKNTIEISIKRYENTPDIGNIYVYALSKVFGKNFKIISLDSKTDKKIH
tara:strand:+ start:357 stop:572 length:216 start_codon:yes stop_codon:yes gene_type:complete